MISVEAFVLPKLTSQLPSCKVNSHPLFYLKDIPLADPNFHALGKIDLLLEANIYTQIIENGIIKGSPGELIAQRLLGGYSRVPSHLTRLLVRFTMRMDFNAR